MSKCKPNQSKLCGKKNCEICLNRSFSKHFRAKQWSDKNELKPRDVFKSSEKHFWFRCDCCTHEFNIRLTNISNKNQWCPYCSHRKLCDCEDCFEKSFASSDKAQYWSDKNELKPRDVFKSSEKHFWFRCDCCSHEFNIRLYSISNNNQWCPYCSHRKLCDCENCFEKSFESSGKAQYWSDKNKLKPREVFKYNHKKFWFKCDSCRHEFDISLTSISGGNQWCPYCSHQKLCDCEDCEDCFEKSFASSDKAQYWSDKNKLKPRELFKCNNKKFWFNCGVCRHEFDVSLANISKGSWCSYCSHQKLCDCEDCEDCFEKSFASSGKAQYWSDKNKLKPREVFKYTNKHFWFRCDCCMHEFSSRLLNISNGNHWCPYCKNKKICNDDNCEDCFEKSFASSGKAQYWSDKNKLKPRDVFKYNHKKFWFNCDRCKNTFSSNLANISNGRWCPHCKNKTELKLYEYLKSVYPQTKREVKFYWCKNEQPLRFDFVIDKIILELDGRQHFHQVWNWKTPEEVVYWDNYKMNCATEYGYKIIRIPQEWVYNDTFDWEMFIINSIVKLNKTKLSPFIIIPNNAKDMYISHNIY